MYSTCKPHFVSIQRLQNFTSVDLWWPLTSNNFKNVITLTKMYCTSKLHFVSYHVSVQGLQLTCSIFVDLNWSLISTNFNRDLVHYTPKGRFLVWTSRKLYFFGFRYMFTSLSVTQTHAITIEFIYFAFGKESKMDYSRPTPLEHKLISYWSILSFFSPCTLPVVKYSNIINSSMYTGTWLMICTV